MRRSMSHFLLPIFLAAGFSTSAYSQSAVQVAPFRSIELRAGGQVLLRHGPEQRVTLVHGSTRYTRFHVDRNDKLVIEACNDSCPRHYDLDIEIETPRIDGVAISGGGEIRSAPGFAEQPSISVAVDGGGNMDVRSIPTANASAAVDGGGAIKLHADRHLDAAVNGGGAILFWGNPSVTSAVEGGGAVSRGAQ
jgi:hypothetical protein